MSEGDLKMLEPDMKINLMTWNTRMYEYGNKINGVFRPIDDDYFDGVINVISDHLKKENAIAILQEIPYVCNITWQKHELFLRFNQRFENDFFVKYNISSKKQIMMTVIISQKELIKWNKDGFNDNRSISFKLKDEETRFLGLHAKNNTLTASYLDNIRPHSYDYILGDFNSGNYTKWNEDASFKKNRTAYCEYLNNYIDICKGEATTIYDTPIDHILTSNNNIISCIIDKSISLSDHYPIFAEIEI